MSSAKRVDKMRKLIATAACVFLGIFSLSAQANCTYTSGWGSGKELHMTLPASLAVGNHLPVGSVIHTQEMAIGPSYQEYARCTMSTDYIQGRPGNGYGYQSGQIITHTSSPGVGFRVTITIGQETGIVIFRRDIITAPLTSLNLGPDPKIKLEIIKLSNAGGRIVSGYPVFYRAISTTIPSDAAFALRLMGTTNLITTTCQVSNPVINVAMGDVNTSIFSRVGSVSPDRNFNIQLNCDPQANVSVTVDAVADTSNAQGVLSLSALPDKASGVGIQVLQNNAAVTFGQAKSIGTSAGGIYNIPMSARYYQTQGQVSAGKANGTATFTMTYN
ncbi:fimbrial protein [Pantoea endophytica]